MKYGKLNRHAVIAWLFVMECHQEYGSLKKGGVIDLGCNLLRHYPAEFEALEMVYSAIHATKRGEKK
jgi:hypothetical protein